MNQHRKPDNNRKEQRRPHQGRWPKGKSGNPSGRPVGSRNKATLLVEQLLEGEAEQLTRKAIERALEGDAMALRLCLERILPPRRERCIDLPLPASKTASEVSAALAGILAAVGEGRITPGEGETLARMVEIQRQVIEVEELERRVQELENAVAQNRGRRRVVVEAGELEKSSLHQFRLLFTCFNRHA